MDEIQRPTALSRAAARGGKETRYEDMDRAFHARLRDGFLAIAKSEPERCRVIDASADVDAIHRQILAAVTPLFASAP